MKYFSVLCIFVMLLTILVAPSYAATTEPSLAVVSGSVVVSPGTVMAGDSGTVTITVINSLKSATGVGDSHSTSDTINYGTSTSDNQAVSHSTTQTSTSSDVSYANAYLSTVSLGNSGPIHVDPQQPQGTMLGMGDTVSYTFPFSVDSDAQDGLYQLLFRVTTTDSNVYLNYMVPVRVDNTPVQIFVDTAPSFFSTAQQSVTLDVVNNRANDVSSVSVIPSGDGYSFQPQQQYIIGSIGAGQMYTAQIQVSGASASNDVGPQFKVVYQNGLNWHNSTPATVTVDNSKVSSSANSGNGGALPLVLGIIVVALIVIGALFFFLRSKRAKQ
jgi:hypothetical protein